MSFWKKLKSNENGYINSAEYDRVYKRIVELSAAIEELKNKIAILNTNYDNLRGNFNRKLSGLKEVKEEQEKEETENNIKASVFLSPNGNPI